MDYKSKLKRNLKVYYLMYFLEGLLFTIPVWYAYQEKYLSIEQLGIVYAFFSFLTFILEMPTGAIADLFGRKSSMFIGWILSGIGVIILGLSTEFMQFVLGFGLYGFGISLVSGANYALLYDSLKELGREDQFTKQVADNGSFTRLSMMIGSFTGGILFAISPGLPFILQGIAFLVLAIVILFLQEPMIDSEKFTFKNYINQTKLGFQQLFKTKQTTILSFYYFLTAGISWTVLTYFRLPYVYSYGFTEVQVSLIIGIGYIITSLLLMYASRKKQIFNKKIIFFLNTFLILFILLPSHIFPVFFVPVILVLIQIVGSGRFTFLDSYTNEGFESKYRATAVSSLNMLVNIIYFLLVLISGPIISSIGISMFFVMLGMIATIILLPLTYIVAKD